MGYNQKCARRMKQNQTSLILFLSRCHGRRRRQKSAFRVERGLWAENRYRSPIAENVFLDF